MAGSELMGKSPSRSTWMDIASRGRLFTGVFESSADPLVVADARGWIIEANAAMEKITGMSRERLVGGEFAVCFSQPEQVREVLLRVRQEREIRNCAWSVAHESGSTIGVTCNATLFFDASGTALGTFFLMRDTTDVQQYEAQMLFQASYDALTALPNRRMFRERLDWEMAQARRNGQLLGVLCIDIDDFKEINDTLGHSIGDEVLQVVAWRLQASVRKTDILARMGGDRFALLIREADRSVVHSADAIVQLAHRLMDVVVQPCTIEGHELVVSCSIGLTMYPHNDGNVDALLSGAEAAMYRAKSDGKNRLQLCTPEMNASMQRQVDICERLRHSLSKSELTLHYQPRVELASGQVTGVEALIRWQPEGEGMISPAEFIPVAERNGMIVPIGEWVLFEACRQARKWQHETGIPVNMAVNLSARQLRDVDIVKLVARVLAETELPAHLLELELTESMLIHDTKQVLCTLEALKELGVSLAIDDFGTGYSSLSYLKSFPLDFLKIDRSFVMDLCQDPSDAAIVGAIIYMAHSLGLKVIAEGVETREQLDFLLERDCDMVQGYYFSKPLPRVQLNTMLEENRIFDV